MNLVYSFVLAFMNFNHFLYPPQTKCGEVQYRKGHAVINHRDSGHV